MKPIKAALVPMLFLLAGGSAQAQYGSHKFDLGVNGGYVWTWAREAYYTNGGEIDLKDNGYWGVTLDFNAAPGKQLELMYRRQDTKLTFQAALTPKTDLADVAMEYWQIGGLAGAQRGDVLPYGLFTIGATRFVLNAPWEDEWRFSMVFGLGAKKYVSDKLGIRVQAQLPFTWVDGGGSIACGGGGCITTVGGEGIGQVDVGGGLLLQF